MAYNFISNSNNLVKLKHRFQNNLNMGTPITAKKTNTPEECTWHYWIDCVQFCIDEKCAMDETDYANSPKEVRDCWKGLKDKNPMEEVVY